MSLSTVTNKTGAAGHNRPHRRASTALSPWRTLRQGEGRWRAGGHAVSQAWGGACLLPRTVGRRHRPGWAGSVRGHLPSQVKAHRDTGMSPAPLPCLNLLVPLEHHGKQASLCGSSRLLNHGLFFPQDITCYLRVSFQKVLNDLA